MNLLVVSQVFWPDTVSTGQHLHEFCEYYTKKESGSVTVFTSKYNYENKQISYPSKEVYNNISIHRFNHTKFGKKTILGRILDFASFNIVIFFRLLFINRARYDAILCTTPPPLLPFIVVIISKFKRLPFIYWAMDLQPELSINCNLIKKGSIQANFLEFIGNYTFKHSDKIIALDELMKRHIYSRSSNPNIEVVPVWPVLTSIYDGERLDNPFRQEHFQDKIVIMYSGNHSFVHPLDTILELAHSLKDHDQFCFAFIGEGTQKNKVVDYIENKQCHNIVQLPYQPKENIHISLSSADFQVVVMGDQNNGITHPNKIYGAMLAGCEILYVGPQDSFISSILNDCQQNISVNHGDVTTIKNILLEKSHDIHLIREQGKKNYQYAKEHFNPERLKEQMSRFILS